MSYKKPPIEDEPDVVPIVFTTILPPTSTTTMGHGLKWWMLVAIVAGMLLLVLAGGTVVQRDGASYTTIAEGLLVAMAANDDDCLPAVGTFSGTSMMTDLGEDDHFETCCQYGNASLYCWTKSYYDKHQGWLQCVPNGEGGGFGRMMTIVLQGFILWIPNTSIPSPHPIRAYGRVQTSINTMFRRIGCDRGCRRLGQAGRWRRSGEPYLTTRRRRTMLVVAVVNAE